MAKKDHLFFCSECGNEFSRWVGQCPACNSWNTLKEAPKQTARDEQSVSKRLQVSSGKNKPTLLSDVKQQQQSRIPTCMSEFDPRTWWWFS